MSISYCLCVYRDLPCTATRATQNTSLTWVQHQQPAALIFRRAEYHKQVCIQGIQVGAMHPLTNLMHPTELYNI